MADPRAIISQLVSHGLISVNEIRVSQTQPPENGEARPHFVQFGRMTINTQPEQTHPLSTSAPSLDSLDLLFAAELLTIYRSVIKEGRHPDLVTRRLGVHDHDARCHFCLSFPTWALSTCSQCTAVACPPCFTEWVVDKGFSRRIVHSYASRGLSFQGLRCPICRHMPVTAIRSIESDIMEAVRNHTAHLLPESELI